MFSCDARFEQALYLAGFKSRYLVSYEYGKMSSYSKGCANHLIDDFHIISETSSRPRFQCGTCTRLDEIESSGHYNGPLGAGNDLLHRGAINGWFFNHKSDFLFYEGYLDLSACRGLPLEDFIPLCDELTANEPYDHDLSARSYRSIISVADGYSYHLDHGCYCRINTNQQDVLEKQSKSTYMRDYASFLALINNISDEAWDLAYKIHPGGTG
jgi:hypothetical protein